MRKFFNTAGPCVEGDHYMINPLNRLTAVRQLIEEERYFTLHAPRQTGKTTTMIAFMNEINEQGKYIALYVNVENAQPFRSKVEMANEVMVSSTRRHIMHYLDKAYWPSEHCYKVVSRGEYFSEFLTAWCQELPKPLVLFMDEVDALIGDSLLSVLRQLRSGYNIRPKSFPHALAIIGLRDLRDYRIFSDREQRFVIGGSAFNIKDQSLTVKYFTPEQIDELLAQHTAATGQVFQTAALEKIFWYTQGQPWLVNALGRELCFGESVIPFNQEVTESDVRDKVEILILRRDVHLDQLADKLTEPRMERIIQGILLGEDGGADSEQSSEDYQYAVDLGLIQKRGKHYEIANPIYREVIPRELVYHQQYMLPEDRQWYLLPDGKLDIRLVVERFVEFYRENGETWMSNRYYYKEAAFQLLFQAWLQRLVNGGGRITREYAAGSRRLDILVEYAGEKHVFELKRDLHFKRQDALEQTADYAKRMGADFGWVLIFRKKFSVDNMGQRETDSYGGIGLELVWL